MIVENEEVFQDTIKGAIALTLDLMGKSKYEIRQALIVANDLFQSSNTAVDFIKYYSKLKFKD